MPLKDAFRTQVLVRKLPELQQRIADLERTIEELKQR
jgi:hypothetical protein